MWALSWSDEASKRISERQPKPRAYHFSTRSHYVKTCDQSYAVITVVHNVHMDIVGGSNEHARHLCDNDDSSQTVAKAMVGLGSSHVS